MVTENTETLYLLLWISYKQVLSMFCNLMMSPQILKRSIDAKKVILQHQNLYLWLNLSHNRTLSNTITNYKKELCTLFIMIMGLASKNYVRRTNPLPFKKFSYRDWDSFLFSRKISFIYARCKWHSFSLQVKILIRSAYTRYHCYAGIHCCAGIIPPSLQYQLHLSILDKLDSVK